MTSMALSGGNQARSWLLIQSVNHWRGVHEGGLYIDSDLPLPSER